MNIIEFKKLSSTNLYAKEHLRELKNFDVIFAHSQSAGYGQWGRKWIDTGDENIYMTIVLKPDNLNYYTDIVRYCAVCLCQTFSKYNVVPKIKEPNDVIINDKKIAGILAESVSKGKFIKGLIIGIGVNLNTTEEVLSSVNQPATSLNIELGSFVNKKIFMETFLSEFENNLSNFVEKKFKLNSFL